MQKKLNVGFKYTLTKENFNHFEETFSNNISKNCNGNTMNFN